MPEMYAIQIIAYESYDMSLPLGDSFTNFTLCLFVPFWVIGYNFLGEHKQFLYWM